MIYLIFCIAALAHIILLLYNLRKQWRNRLGFTQKRFLHGGYIYIFQTEFFWLVKIGRAADPITRMKAFKTANAGGVKVLAAFKVKDAVKAEKIIHRYFCHNRVSKRNEWFKLSLGLILFIFLVRDTALTERINECIR